MYGVAKGKKKSSNAIQVGMNIKNSNDNSSKQVHKTDCETEKVTV